MAGEWADPVVKTALKHNFYKDFQMKKTLIISLVSNQTIPNVQFAKWYRNENPLMVSDLFFISTAGMERQNKSELIRNALDISDFPYEGYGTIEVDENSLMSIRKKLVDIFSSPHKEFDVHSYGKIVLNMTGGTKIMSLAAFQYFSEFKNTEIYYKAFGEKILQVFPNERTISATAPVSLEEFLTANDIAAEETGEFMKDFEFNSRFYEKCLRNNAEGLKVISKLGEAKNADGTFSISNMRNGLNSDKDVNKAMNIANFCHFSPERITGVQESFMKSGWFEEYVCQTIMEKYGIAKENIALNLKIERGNDKNELDVVYVGDGNTLHIVECKALVQKKDTSQIINDALYKLKSLTTKFGLKVKGHIYTKATEIGQMYRDRAKEFDIEIVDGTMI